MTTAKVMLTDLTVDEGSLVDKGDNPEAHVVIAKAAPTGLLAKLRAWAGGVFKQEAGEQEAPKTTAAVLAEQEFLDEFSDLRCAFLESVASILSSAPTENTGAMLRVSVEEFATRMQQLVGSMESASAKRVTALVDDMRAAALAEAQGDVSKRQLFVNATATLDGLRVTKEGGSPMKTLAEIMAALSPEDRKVVEEALAAKAQPMADAAKAGSDCAPTEKAAEPPLPPAVQKALDETAKRAADAEAEVKKLRDEKRAADFVAKAQSLNVTGQDVTVLGATLMKAADAGIGDAVESLVKALAEQAKAGNALMQKLGTKGGGAEPSSAETRVQSLADAIRKEDPKLTPQQAFVKALERDKALAKETLDAAR